MAAEELPRQHSDVLVESTVRDAFIRLNPEIKAQPDRADEVHYRLWTIPLSVQSEGLVRANELFAEWLRGEKSIPFGERGEHTQVAPDRLRESQQQRLRGHESMDLSADDADSRR